MIVVQVTVGEYGRQLLQGQSIYVKAIESGLGKDDFLEVPEGALFTPCIPQKNIQAVPTLKDYARAFLSQKNKVISMGSCSLYDEYLTKNILPFFGGDLLNDITESKIQDFVTLSARKGRSASYIRSQVVLLKSILRNAEHDGLIKMPDFRITYPKQSVNEITVLSDEDTEKLSDYLINEKKTISTAILIALHTGIRIGEMCGLRWSDIDFRKNCLHIQRSVKCYYLPSIHKSVTEIGQTKTVKSNRKIYFTSDFGEILERRQGDGYIYTGTEHFIDTCSARQALDRRLGWLDIPHVRFHALRHGFATRAIRKGVDPKTVAAILGHERCDITLDIYTACTPEMQVEAMERMR